MEIRNNTPSFGMAVRKPSKKVLEQLDRIVDPRGFKAFLKEQAKLKNIDIELGQDSFGLYAALKAKEGADLQGYVASNKIWRFDGARDFFDEQRDSIMREFMEFVQNHPKLAASKLCRGIMALKETGKYLAKILYTYALKPERVVPTELRQAGDKAILLDKAISKSTKNIKEFSELM